MFKLSEQELANIRISVIGITVSTSNVGYFGSFVASSFYRVLASNTSIFPACI